MHRMAYGTQAGPGGQLAGYRAWQRPGRRVRRGEKGFAIPAPVSYRRRYVGDVDPEAVVGVLSAFRVAFVFDTPEWRGPIVELTSQEATPIRGRRSA